MGGACKEIPDFYGFYRSSGEQGNYASSKESAVNFGFGKYPRIR
jgi:hypothetical protein